MKEKLDKKIVFMVQKTLYNDFKNCCESEYKTMSEVVRDFMLQYIKENKNARKKDIE
jgi:metal-responsive CopG/Arc/MetJ family transcriptional regulator